MKPDKPIYDVVLFQKYGTNSGSNRWIDKGATMSHCYRQEPMEDMIWLTNKR
jgi:hypothetical protein